ncbi:integrase core domain-containing protein [Desulfovibrio sp. 86]|uniref:integrase core domain-containing protein n=1 Tax=Desulfovibrio sp. 86 TaxID=2666132 RepID=UPI0015D23441
MNGPTYRSWKFRDACREFGIKHKRTKPCRPQANGKAERFSRTALNEWAYAETYAHSWKRKAYLPMDAALYLFAATFGPWQKTSSFEASTAIYVRG